MEEKPQPSFFHYFGEPKDDEDEEEEEKEEDEEEERIQFSRTEDFEIAHVIRNRILPEAVHWYTGEAHDDEYDDIYGDEEEDDGEDEEDGDEDEDEDDDDDDDAPAPKGKAGGAKGGKPVTGASAPSSGATKPGAAPAPGEQPECKQN